MADLLHGKCFSKWIGPENGAFRLGRDNVVIQRLGEPYANRGAVYGTSLATESGTRPLEASWSATLHMPCLGEYKLLNFTNQGQLRRIKSGESSEQVWRANVSHADCSGESFSALDSMSRYGTQTIKAVETNELQVFACIALHRDAVNGRMSQAKHEYLQTSDFHEASRCHKTYLSDHIMPSNAAGITSNFVLPQKRSCIRSFGRRKGM